MFELPNNWHIITTEENIKDVWEWRMGEPYILGDRNLRVNQIAGICGNGEKGHNPLGSLGSPNDSFWFGSEITYEQFQEHVLGKKPKKSVKEDTSYLINFLKQNNIT